MRPIHWLYTDNWDKNSLISGTNCQIHWHVGHTVNSTDFWDKSSSSSVNDNWPQSHQWQNSVHVPFKHRHEQSNGLAWVAMNSSTSPRGHSHHFSFSFSDILSLLVIFTYCMPSLHHHDQITSCSDQRTDRNYNHEQHKHPHSSPDPQVITPQCNGAANKVLPSTSWLWKQACTALVVSNPKM